MRLIDADKLYGELEELSKRKESTDEQKKDAQGLAGFIWLMGKASTIEAIPVDWLREHRKQMRLKRSARIIEQLVRLYQEEQER